jgi:WW domain-binding protein 2
MQIDVDNLNTRNGKCVCSSAANHCDNCYDMHNEAHTPLLPWCHFTSRVLCRWKAKGDLFVTNMRLVFVATLRDEASGLEAFDIPLLYIRNDSFNQPVFGCNHLAGECWPVSEQGGPSGSLPPHKYRLYFLQGGIGTVLPLYYRFLKLVRAAEHDRKAAEELANQGVMNEQVSHAFVDPNDPTKLFLTQPVGIEQRLPTAPVYASNYGANEAYEPMV